MEYLNKLGSSLGCSRPSAYGAPRDLPSFSQQPFSNPLSLVHRRRQVLRDQHGTDERAVPAPESGAQRVKCIARYGYKDRSTGNEDFEGLLMEQLKSFQRRESWEAMHAGEEAEEKIQFLELPREAEVVYLFGHSEVRASKNLSLLKRVAANYVYNFLRRNCRQGFIDLFFQISM